MFISNETDLFVSTICLIVGLSSAALIGCSFCCYRKCCVTKSDPLIRNNNNNGSEHIISVDNENFAYNPDYMRSSMVIQPTAPQPYEFGSIPRAKTPPPTYDESTHQQNPGYQFPQLQLYPNLQFNHNYNQAQTRF